MDTLEPGDVDQYGNRYADEAAYNKAQDALAATPQQYNCLECGVLGDSKICSNCEDIWGGDSADDQMAIKPAFDQHAPF